MKRRKLLFGLLVCSLLSTLVAPARLARYARPINPYVDGPAPLEVGPCTRRNGCIDALAAAHRMRDTTPIAEQLGEGDKLGIQRLNGYPPGGIGGPVNRLLTNIPPAPGMRLRPPSGNVPGIGSSEDGPPAPPEFLPSPAVWVSCKLLLIVLVCVFGPVFWGWLWVLLCISFSSHLVVLSMSSTKRSMHFWIYFDLCCEHRLRWFWTFYCRAHACEADSDVEMEKESIKKGSFQKKIFWIKGKYVIFLGKIELLQIPNYML